MESFVNISYLRSGIQMKDSNTNLLKNKEEIENNNRRIKYYQLSNGLNEVIQMFDKYKKSNFVKETN